MHSMIQTHVTLGKGKNGGGSKKNSGGQDAGRGRDEQDRMQVTTDLSKP